MMDIFSAIYEILTSDTDVSALVGDKVYPVIIPDMDVDEKVIKASAIVIARTGLDPTYAKGCGVKTAENYHTNNDSTTVSIEAKANSYYEGLKIIKYVRKTLELFKGEVEGVTINKCRVVDLQEGYDTAHYFQRLIVDIK